MKFLISILFLFLLFIPMRLSACPKVRGLIDFNCDKKSRFLVTGDSIVYGSGDTENGNKGGYVARLSRSFGSTKVMNAGVYGITTGQLLRRFESGEYNKLIKNLDLVIIDLGRNDCRDYIEPESIFRSLKRLVKFFSKTIRTEKGGSPFVTVATEAPARNTYRRPCIEELNQILLRKKQGGFPVHLRFDSLPDTILSSDGIHPDSDGYDAIADVAEKFIRGELQKLQSKLRPDSDLDGLYDYFEIHRFGTDPSIADSDGDGFADGAEVLNKTDPLVGN